MKVCQINTKDVQGGAARAAYRLNSALNKLEGINSVYFVKNDKIQNCKIITYKDDLSFFSRLRRKAYRKKIRYEHHKFKESKSKSLEIFTDARTPYNDVIEQLPSGLDLINLHWIAHFVDYKSLFEACEVPIVWTLHDMNPFTGGCHYNVGCEKYTDECGSCPLLGSNSEKDLSNRIWNIKKSSYKEFNQPFHIVAPSKWLESEIKKSSLLSLFPVHHIPNGIDTSIYYPIEKKLAKEALGIQSSKKVMLFLAESSDNKRKGYNYLSNALEEIRNVNDVFFLSAGKNKPDLNSDIGHLHVGYVDDNSLLRLIFSASDIFVIPSLQDNLPNTVLEAMACGTPVIGFDIGGIPDMIEHKESGLLVENIDSLELKYAIDYMIENDEKRKKMGKRSFEIIQERFTQDRQARAYMELYMSILNA